MVFTKQVLRSSVLLAALAALAPYHARADIANDPIDFGNVPYTYSYGMSVADNGNAAVYALSLSPTVAIRSYFWSSSTGLVDMGTLGGSYTILQSISANGLVVVGEATLANGYWHAFRWTSSTGLVDLGSLGGWSLSTNGMSSDGSVLVGQSYNASNQLRAWYWTEATGMVNMGTLGGTASWATGVSHDGSVIVGDSFTSGGADHSYRWTQATGMVDIGSLGGSLVGSTNISPDGAVIFGYGQITGDSALHVFRWTQATGMVDLGLPNGTSTRGTPLFSSYDGGIIAGWYYITGASGAYHSFLWTQASGFIDPGTLGGSNTFLNGLTTDGSIAVGGSNITGNATTHAILWTRAAGLQDLNTLLSNAGVNMTGITLLSAKGISSNGKYIVGQGVFPGNANGHAFLVCYDLDNRCVGVTTEDRQADAAETLAHHVQTTMERARVPASEILGFTRPVDERTYAQAGGMFGSVFGYAGGQWSHRGVTLLGGVGYGHQDAPDIRQENAPTLAFAARYTFDSPFEKQTAFAAARPYVEAGAWGSPRATLHPTRRYLNGSAVDTVEGKTEAASWAWYGRGGAVWDVTAKDSLNVFGELGKQYMSFDGYTEPSALSNPFPATVAGGDWSMFVARAGGSWTHAFAMPAQLSLDSRNEVPRDLSVTLSAAAARSFAVKQPLIVSSLSVTPVDGRPSWWGEFGGRVEAPLTSQLSLFMDATANLGGETSNRFSAHGGGGLSFAF